MRKKSTLIKISIVLCFLKSARPVYYYLHLYSIKLHSKPFFLPKSQFLHFNPKNCGLKDNFSEVMPNFYPLKCTTLCKNSFRYYLCLERKMSLKSDQLEILLGVFSYSIRKKTGRGSSVFLCKRSRYQPACHRHILEFFSLFR